MTTKQNPRHGKSNSNRSEAVVVKSFKEPIISRGKRETHRVQPLLIPVASHIIRKSGNRYIFILINISFIRINLWRASKRTNVKNKKIFEMGINEFQALSLSLSLTLFPFGCQYASLFFYSKMGVLEKEHLIRWQHNLKKPTVIFIVMFSIFFLSSNLSMY